MTLIFSYIPSCADPPSVSVCQFEGEARRREHLAEDLADTRRVLMEQMVRLGAAVSGEYRDHVRETPQAARGHGSSGSRVVGEVCAEVEPWSARVRAGIRSKLQ